MTEARGELRVGAHVLVQLGSELVTDVEQALLECVKNAYDADSPGCRISIQTDASGTLEETAEASALAPFGEAAENVVARLETIDGAPIKGMPAPDQKIRRRLDYVGRVIIEDAGSGISFEALSESWLVISASLKRRRTDGPKNKTPSGRTPLGDKGLGRLGTMKLGDILLVESATSPTDEISSAWFRWADCEQAATIDQIPVNLSRRANHAGFKGTRVSVLGLRDIEEWRRSSRLTEITRSLARLISPFEAAASFPVTVELDGGEQSLALVTQQLLTRAVADFSFDWESVNGKQTLIARARLRRRLMTSKRTNALREKTERVFEADDGQGFAAYLRDSKRLKGYAEKHIDPDGPWFAEIEHRFSGKDLFGKTGHTIENPGSFKGAFYFFHFVGDDEDQSAAASGTGASLKLVRDLAGISILRDGFQVRNRGDWLNLSAGMTSGSTYNMRPENTLGYFALSGERNYRLVEKSDREGFVDNPAYRGFLAIARQCRDFANDAIVAVRRSLDEYDRTLLAARKEVEDKSPTGDLAKIGSMATASLRVGQLTATLTQEVEQLVHPQGNSAERRQRVLGLANEVLQLAAGTADDSEAPDLLIKRIEQEIVEGRERSAALVESAAVGLASRGLMHELRTHLAAIRHSVTALERNGSLGKGAASYLIAIRRSCAAISQAAAQVDPLIPRGVESRDEFDVREYIANYFDQRMGVLGTSGISVEVTGGELWLRINKAHILQILDNLARNSVFWLSRLPKGRRREIEVDVISSGFIFTDSGPGIDPLVEETLFDLFVTTRQHEEGGQGLGLFIVSELLALDGCSIALLPNRNKNGRRYKFIIDLSAVRRES